MQLARKLSAKTLGFDKPKIMALLDASKGKPVQLYVIAGRANGVKTGESQYGPWTAFIGSFAAINIAVGKNEEYAPGVEIRSSRAFIPQPMEDAIASALNENEGGVEFSIEVSAVIGDKGDYEYVCNPLVKLAESDELSGLLNASREQLKLAAAKEKVKEKK